MVSVPRNPGCCWRLPTMHFTVRVLRTSPSSVPDRANQQEGSPRPPTQDLSLSVEDKPVVHVGIPQIMMDGLVRAPPLDTE